MSVSSVFYKSAYHAGQGLKKAWNQGIKPAWDTVIGNTRLKKRGLKTFDGDDQCFANLLGGIFGGSIGSIAAVVTRDPAYLLLTWSGVAGLNLVSAYKAGKYDIQQEARKITACKPQEQSPPVLGNP